MAIPAQQPGTPTPRPPRRPPAQPNNYQTFTQNAQKIQATPTAYESDVLGGKYLDVKNNPYVQGYTNALTGDFNKSVGLGLSQVSSPFMSGATLGNTGMNAAARAQYTGEAQRGLTNELAKSYFGLYGDERNRMQGTSGDISGRTNQLVSSSASAYGADQDLRGRIQTAKIAAQTELQKAQMAQQMGYDQLAAQYMQNYEQMQYQAAQDERDYQLKYAGLTGDIMNQFSDQTSSTQGPQQSATGGFFQGLIGGGLTGYGIGQGLGLGGASNPPIRL